MSKNASQWVDFQARAREFAVDDVVHHRLSDSDQSGRVVEVYPGIGMVDVQFPHGSTRLPVEDVQRISPARAPNVPPMVENNSIPGGRETVWRKMAVRLASAHLKRALYWGARDRQYRATRSECETGRLYCPKHPDSLLVPTAYKRREGQSVKLLGCRECMFLIKQTDIVGMGE